MTAHSTFGNRFRLVAVLGAGVLLVATADVAFARIGGGVDHGDRGHDGEHYDHSDWGHDGEHHHHQVPVHGPGSSHNPVVYHPPHPAGLVGQVAVKGLKPTKVKVNRCATGGGGGGSVRGGSGGVYCPH
jgi:hypothetical protein